VFGGFLFCVTHALLSPLFFYLVDCVQRRYNSRSILEIYGLLQSTPNLGVSIVISLILYSGLPGTLKFVSEFTIFIGLLETAPVSIVILLYLTNVVGLLGVFKGWFNIVFGLNVKDQSKIPADLNIKEFLIIYTTILLLILFNLCVNIYI
jgi:NADH:ubiquinone oxidoreductase subunit 4 (subunit M)